MKHVVEFSVYALIVLTSAGSLVHLVLAALHLKKWWEQKHSEYLEKDDAWIEGAFVAHNIAIVFICLIVLFFMALLASL